MTNLIKKFTLIVFVLVIVQISIFGFMSLISGDPLNTIAQGMSIYDVKTVTIGTQQQTFLIFNIRTYLKSIEQSVTVNTEIFSQITPPSFTPKWNDPVQAIKSVFNILIYLVNWIIFITNLLLLAPIKLLISPILFVYSILGVDFTQLWLIQVVKAIFNANIPFIPIV